MELYIIKSTACLSVFFLFYKLLLEKENMHVFKRFYLLASLIFAFSIPFITFTSYVFVAPMEEFLQVTALNEDQDLLVYNTDRTNYLAITLWSIYALGVVFFGSMFIKNISQLFAKIKRNPQIRNNRTTNVLLLHSVIPHTFFKYIFLNKSDFENKKIPQEVLIHEETHALQKHSIDILFIELLQIVFWFNPLIYMIKHAIKLNHEFLADQAVLNKGIKTSNYQKLLLNFSASTNQPQLANAINYSFTRLNGLFSKKSFGQVKKRFTIMKTHTSNKSIWLRSLVLLPLLAVLIYGFSEKVTVKKSMPLIQKQKTNDTEAKQDRTEVIRGFIEREEKQEKATPEQIAEYNAIAKAYNEKLKSRTNTKIILKDVKRLTYIYGLMTETQKKKAEAFPNIPPPPPPLESPTVNGSKNIPPPPPPPPVPSEHMKELAKKGAVFFYEGKKITAQKAQKIVESNKNIQIQVLDHDTNKPIVKLSSIPYTYKKK